MRIKETELKASYFRSIESMGEGLVLFKVRAAEKAIGQNYHVFYKDNVKPPLDIAVNPNTNAIEYVSFFVQDKLIKEQAIKLSLEQTNKNVSISFEELNDKKFSREIDCSFEVIFSEGNLYILNNMMSSDMSSYQLNSKNNILFDSNGIFGGLILLDISKSELDEMKKSLVI